MSKPKTATSAPFFQVCKKCGKHGRIIIPSRDQVSLEILTQGDGVVSAEYAFDNGLIKEDELPELKRQAKTSTLPEAEPDVNIIFCRDYIIIRYREMRAAPENETGIGNDNVYVPENVTLH